MIRRIVVIFRRTGVWSSGSAYDAKTQKYSDGQVIWAKEYPKGFHMRDVWGDLRRQSIGFFADIFHDAVVFQTKPPKPMYTPGEDINGVLNRQSKYLQKRVFDYPEIYEFVPDHGKWAMSESGYIKRTTELGGNIEIGVSDKVSTINYDHTLIDAYEKKLSGQTKSFVLFVYPDRYDADVRAMFEIQITYW